MNQEYDVKHGLGASNRISLVVFWLRGSLIGLLLLLPVSCCNNWSGGYHNLITSPRNTDALWTPFRSSGRASQTWKGNNKLVFSGILHLQTQQMLPSRGLVLCHLLSHWSVAFGFAWWKCFLMSTLQTYEQRSTEVAPGGLRRWVFCPSASGFKSAHKCECTSRFSPHNSHIIQYIYGSVLCNHSADCFSSSSFKHRRE